MLDAGQQSSLVSRVRVMQLLIAAMAMGVVAFLVIAYFVHAGVGVIDKAHNLDVVTHIALVYGVVALIGGPILAGALVKVGRRRLAQLGATARPAAGTASGFGDNEQHAHARQLASLLVTKTILSGAIYEGAALFLAVGYLLNRSILTGVCSIIMLVVLLMQMPSKDRAQRWIEDQARQIGQEVSGSQ